MSHTSSRPCWTPGERLTLALRTALENGHRPPCTLPDRWHLWTSDDIAERNSAARQCSDCPITEACSAAADHQGERWGVWAGRDYDPKRRKRKATT